VNDFNLLFKTVQSLLLPLSEGTVSATNTKSRGTTECGAFQRTAIPKEVRTITIRGREMPHLRTRVRMREYVRYSTLPEREDHQHHADNDFTRTKSFPVALLK